MATFPAWTYVLAVLTAAGFEVMANLMLARSEGFARIRYSLGALVLVGFAFTFLAYAVRGMDLPVAYTLWGGFGILGTSLGGWIMLGQRLHASAWFGILLLIGGMAVLHLGG